MKYIEYSCAEKIASITINRPDHLNALNRESLIELSQCWEKFKEDPFVWCALLTGKGDRAFSVGMDVKEDVGEKEKEGLFDLTLEVSPRYHAINKPTLCAIKGYCLGLGWWLAMECDLRIASHDAKFGIPETHLNISPIFGGLLTQHLPPAIALEVLLSGEPLESRRAYEMGFVNRLAGTPEVEKESVKLAQRICRNAPVSVRRTKELYYQGLEMNRNGSVSLAKLIYKELEGMDDSKEARQAFKEKRQPNWKGR